MSFIQQQIESFLNLGGCKEYLTKEYLTMARPRIPGSKTKKDTLSPNGMADATQVRAAEALAANTLGSGVTQTEARKLEVVKGEGRATLLPINLEDEIRRRAYEIYERRGYTSGHETEDWLIAEREVLQRYGQQSA
jgi:hypothetical protein